MDERRRPRYGIIFILSAPSGAGKTTISHAALERFVGLEASISVTTRKPRTGEQEGADYHFVTEDEFNNLIAADELAESARVFDACYGTPRRPLQEAVEEGRDILLDIDIQGARQIRRGYPEQAVTIFVLPPSFAELEGRLRRRGTENEEAIGRRLQRARDEASALKEYDYLIVNDDLEESLSQLATIIECERLRVRRLREGFAPWKS